MAGLPAPSSSTTTRRPTSRTGPKARALGRSLLTLDTRTADHAEPLYESIGYRTSGIIPGYCLDPFKPEFDSTTIMFKQL